MRIGLVGAGFMGNTHLAAYAKMSGVEVVGVADSNLEAAGAGAALVGARPYASYREMADSEDFDLVDLCLPTPRHRDLAVEVAADGKHVILEKPIARTLEEAKEILAAFSDGGKRLFVGHVVRFFPEYVALKEMYDSGEVGEVGVVRTSRKSPFLVGWNDWYADLRFSGGMIVDLLIHDFDFLRWTFGEVERVYAKSVFHNEYNRLDYALITLRHESGVISHVEGHWGYPAPFCYSIEIAGTRRLATLDSEKRAPFRVLSAKPKDDVAREIPDDPFGKSPYQMQLEHFIRCVETGEESVVGGEDAREALRISLAALESARTGTPVTLTERS